MTDVWTGSAPWVGTAAWGQDVPPLDLPVTLEELKRHLNYRDPGAEHSDDLELELFLISSISVVEDIVGPFAAREVVETVASGTGTAVLRQCPVLSVTSPAGLQLNGAAGIVTGLPVYGGPVTVTYVAGQTVRPEQRLAVLLVAQDLWQTQRGAGSSPLDGPDELAPDPTLLRRVRLLLRATALPPSVG